ncbi:MAG: hypothetical protein A2133_05200 [Actinobacteria bacterium RBG_16_64_13]|nr:MAG: hypothetical protein A2133_05200 [Actinobacteria bacterium RBG_16_64_13]
MNEPRRWSRQATLGVVLIAAGVVIGVVILVLTLPQNAPLSPGTTSAGPLTPLALGERIFTTGRDENGRTIPRSAFMMFAGATCAQCHGSDAKGRTIRIMMGSFDTPDIRWSTLSQPMLEPEGEIEPPYDARTFARALTQGIDSAGGALNAPMSRWDLTLAQVEALIAFLKTK